MEIKLLILHVLRIPNHDTQDNRVASYICIKIAIQLRAHILQFLDTTLPNKNELFYFRCIPSTFRPIFMWFSYHQETN